MRSKAGKSTGLRQQSMNHPHRSRLSFCIAILQGIGCLIDFDFLLCYTETDRKGKPGESRGRKAMGLKPGLVMTARLPKLTSVILNQTIVKAGEPGKNRLAVFKPKLRSQEPDEYVFLVLIRRRP
jgi:hypothetical protein